MASGWLVPVPFVPLEGSRGPLLGLSLWAPAWMFCLGGRLSLLSLATRGTPDLPGFKQAIPGTPATRNQERGAQSLLLWNHPSLLPTQDRKMAT